ncbi:MAG: hypothetical protein KAS66_05260 [Candidatus Omnitrophica bacterium]|nr:hypothetical protein [Candidatus Omnitrophota bacterium]
MGEGDNRERWMGRTEGTGDFMTDLGAFAEGIPGLVQGAYESPLGYALPFGFPYKAAQEFGILGDGRPSGGVPSGMPQQGGILDWLDRMYQGADRFGGQQQRPEGLEEQKAAIAADIERRQQERAAAVAASAAAKMRPSGVGRDSGRSYSAADARERASRQRDPSAKYGGREYGR